MLSKKLKNKVQVHAAPKVEYLKDKIVREVEISEIKETQGSMFFLTQKICHGLLDRDAKYGG